MGKHILVTGSIRSGSTWIGRVISQSSKIRYIGEPFNLSIRRHEPIFENWYECLINRPLSEQVKAKVYLTSFYSIFDRKLYTNHFRHNRFKFLNKLIREIRSRIIRRTLFKDPIAIMSAEWIYNEFNWDIVVIIRHPAAFVASIKLKNWSFDFDDFLRQDNLMSEYLKDFAEDINDYKTKPSDIIENSILVWNCIYSTVLKYQKEYGDLWYFVKHEDLSRSPFNEFEKLCSFLKIDYDNNIHKYLVNTTNSVKEEELKRNSFQNIKAWKDRLTLEEMYRVKEGTRKVWTKFYTEADWG